MVKLVGHTLPESLKEGFLPMQDRTGDLTVAVVFHPWNLGAAEARTEPMSHEEFLADHGVPEDVWQLFRDWVIREGLVIERETAFVFWLRGSFENVARTFKLEFLESDAHGKQFAPANEPVVPGFVAPWIAGVVGLDNVASLYPSVRHPKRTELLANQGQGFFPSDLKTAYRFPAGLDGTGVTLGILEFSNGYSVSDVEGFWQTFNIPAPRLSFVSVDGTPNDGGTSPYDMEATLDVEWAGAMAPGAHLVVYEASAGTSDRSFGTSVLRALEYAVYDKVHQPSVLSVSYGIAEFRILPATLRAWDSIIAQGAMVGITTVIASGDQGAYGRRSPGGIHLHVDGPASSPHAVAVGGTHLILDGQGAIQEETGWTDVNNNGASGGGISQVFSVPSYQNHITLPVKPGYRTGRGVPDVSANADPDTGYAVMFQGASTVVGGTSAAAPVWAAIFTLINQARIQKGLKTVGYANPMVYDMGGTPVFHDIVVGNNSYGGLEGYQCTPGWDPVTGFGTPDVTRLVGEWS